MIHSSPASLALEGDAILIDVDGTLVDSSGAIARVWRAWCERRGVAEEEVFAISEGRQASAVIAELRPDLDADAENRWILAREVEDTGDVTALPGAAEFLKALGPNAWAMVTSGTRALATARLTAAGLPLPPLLVTADDVTESKPSPQGFLLAADRLSVDPGRCVVFEDSKAGLEAARRAGAQPVAVRAAARHPHSDDVPAVQDWRAVVVRSKAPWRLSLETL